MAFEGDRRSSLVGFMRRAAAWPFRVAGARAALNALAGMDGRELADIGLMRSDLRDVSALALDRDPTALLARRALERRRGAFAPPTAPADCDGSRTAMGFCGEMGSSSRVVLLPLRRKSLPPGEDPKAANEGSAARGA
jgi:uncharacterized protein YjiS (DUF1127 family)